MAKKGLFFSILMIILFIGCFYRVDLPALVNGQYPTSDVELPWNLRQIYIDDAWKITKGDPNITIAVLDSGIDFSHPLLEKCQWKNEEEIPENGIDDDNNGYIDDINGWDFVSNDNFPGMSTTDPITHHGTFIAGIIASNHNTSKTIYGIAPNIKIMDIRIIDINNYLANFSLTIFANALKYAIDNGADVISLSLSNFIKATVWTDVISEAYSRNIPIVSAIGNTVNDGTPSGEEKTSYPAALDEVIAVGATNYYEEIADYSNYGDYLEIMAPAGDMDYDDQDHVLYGLDLNHNYRYGYGTSFSVPQVAAVIALMLSVNRNLTVEQIRFLLHSTAIDLGTKGKDKYYGYGLINASAAVEKAQYFTSIPLTEENNTNGLFGISFNGLCVLPLLFLLALKRKKLKLSDSL